MMNRARGLVFWYDVETTGLNSKIHGITELACLIEERGEIIDEYHWKVKPSRVTVIDPAALEKQGITCDDLDTRMPVKAVHGQLVRMLGSYVNSYDKIDKLVQAGFNVGFDDQFLRAMFLSQGDKYYGSWFYAARIDVMSLVAEWLVDVQPMLPNYRLETLCHHFDITIDAHKAISDIVATRKLYYRLKEELCKETHQKAEALPLKEQVR